MDGLARLAESSLRFWGCCAEVADLWLTRRAGAGAVERAARRRLLALVDFARARSPFYSRLYRDVRRAAPLLDELPSVTRRELMDHFDDWSTDRAIRRRDLEAFIADRRRVGERHLGRYWAWKSSGSTGEPGLFLQDEAAMAVYDAHIAAQWDAGRLGAAKFSRLGAAGTRAALVVATGDHFASAVAWERNRGTIPGLDLLALSVLLPVGRIVERLNRFRPGFVAAYPSVLALLAAERRSGRLRIEPAVLWSGGESMAPRLRAALERDFGCIVMDEYGASECLSIAYGCDAGWMHVNADWVLLEPVDRTGRPTPPGELSHTVLLTNLANWVQPVIRYDLGDRVIARAGPCPCGNPLPAVRVEGRKDDMVALTGITGETVRVPPLALSTVVEEASGVHRFQISQVARDHLVLRLPASSAGARNEAWKRSERALRRVLAGLSLDRVRLTLDDRPPRVDSPSGKLRSVIVERERVAA